MNKIREKIMRTNFAKALKRLLILALCVAVLGGSVSVFLLRAQIGEAVTYVQQQEEKRGDENDGRREVEDWSKEDIKNRERYEKERPDWENAITRPSAAAKAAIGITGILCLLIGISFWLFIAAWLYQAAALAGMHGFLWFLLGLGGNAGTAVIFLLARSLIRKKCESCESYQPVKAQYCTKCGAVLSVKCPHCGGIGGKNDQFCRDCGKSFKQE